MKREISWRLPVLMAQRGITSATALAERLTQHGHPVTPTNAARFVGTMPARLDMALFQALLTVLDCSPNDLFGTVPPGGDGMAVQAVSRDSSGRIAGQATGHDAAAAVQDAEETADTTSRSQGSGPARTLPPTPLF